MAPSRRPLRLSIRRAGVLWVVVVLLLMVGVAFASGAVAAAQAPPALVNQPPPTPVGVGIYVNDLGQILTPDDTARLNQRLAELDAQGLAQISVLTLPDTDRELSEFCPVIMNAWGIGHRGKNNGVLVLANATRIVENRSGNRIFIGTGYGLEGQLPDAKLGRILDTYALPYFASSAHSKGITEATLAVAADIAGQPTPLPPSSPLPGSTGSDLPFIVAFILFLLILRFGFGIPIYISGGSGGGWSGGLGGGWSGGDGGFGGGSSGGGGAGR